MLSLHPAFRELFHIEIAGGYDLEWIAKNGDELRRGGIIVGNAKAAVTAKVTVNTVTGRQVLMWW